MSYILYVFKFILKWYYSAVLWFETFHINMLLLISIRKITKLDVIYYSTKIDIGKNTVCTVRI